MRVGGAHRARRGGVGNGLQALGCMGSLCGGAYESTDHEITGKRENPQYRLITDHGGRPVAGL